MSWKSILKSVAPAIGTALGGGPWGGLATKFLIDKLDLPEDTTDVKIQELVQNADPETLLKLKQLDKDFAAEMKKLDVDIFKTEVDDRKSARQMIKTTMWPQVVLSGTFIIGYFAVLGLLLSGVASIPTDFKSETTIILGVLTANIPTIMQFWFGSAYREKKASRSIMQEK